MIRQTIIENFRSILSGYSFSERDLNHPAHSWFTSGEIRTILASGIPLDGQDVRHVIHNITLYLEQNS